jgi:hypothetical protein
VQRDMGLLRALCLAVEEGVLPEQNDRAIYHLDLMLQAGLITADVWEAGERRMISNPVLTPAGHDFVDLARDEELWEWTEGRIAKTVGTTSFGLWFELLRLGHEMVIKTPEPHE